jgi:hypothetical protein
MVSGTITIQASEIASFGWFSLEQIRTMSDAEIYPNIRELALGVSV